MKIRAAALAVTALALAGCASQAAARQQLVQRPANPVRVQPVAAHVPGCTQPAPTTPAGFTRLFASLPPAQWGAADVALSLPVGDGRTVWLWGDTLSTGRFVHSTAIVQTGGCLHVANAGQQLLPNDAPNHIYWITAATNPAASNHQMIATLDRHQLPIAFEITAQRIELTGNCAWCFRDEQIRRTALVSIDRANNLQFEDWTTPLQEATRAATNPGPMYFYGPHHFGYARHAHPEFKLADGGVLVTTCQNWDDGVLHPVASYRPIFTSSR